MKKLTTMKWVAGFAAASSPLVPGLSYFTNTSPPLFPGISSIAAALAAVVIIATLTYQFPRSRRKTGLPVEHRYAVRVLLVAIGCSVGYIILLDLCSVSPPREGARVQIGFGTASWNLTSATLHWIATSPEPPTAEQLMMKRGGYESGGVYQIWQRWAVYLAGTVLLLFYLAGAIFWTLGWTLLARGAPSSDLES
jgi:hypothetical protein